MKRWLTLLLCAAILLWAAAPCPRAQDTPAVIVQDTSAYQGGTFCVYITSQNFMGVGSADFTLHYDPELMTLDSAYSGYLFNGSTNLLSINTQTPGAVSMSAAAVDGFWYDGELAYIYFTVKEDCPLGTYPLEISVGEAWGTDLSPISVGRDSGRLQVTKRPVATEYFYLYAHSAPYRGQNGDTMTVNVEAQGTCMASADFTFRYDSTLFTLDSVTLGTALQQPGSVCSVNTNTPGIVRISFASAEPVYPWTLFQVNLLAINQEECQAEFTCEAYNVYNDQLVPYIPHTTSTYSYLNYVPPAEDLPDLWLEMPELFVGQTVCATLMLEGGAPLAAGDLAIRYDPSVLRCVSVTPAEGLSQAGGMLIVDDNFTDGTIEFPYVNTAGGSKDDLALVDICFEVLRTSINHAQLTPYGTMLYNSDYAPVELESVYTLACLFGPTSEPDPEDSSKELYACKTCGKTRSIPSAPVSISLESLPEKRTYLGNTQALDLTGGVVRLNYSNGGFHRYPMTPEMVTGFDNTVAGEQTLTVTLEGFQTTFSVEIVKATVSFLDWDGTLLLSGSYMGGETISVPADPQRPANLTYRYQFSGWDKPVDVCTGDAQYTATYKESYIDYTVVFCNADGTVLNTQTCHYGDPLTVPGDPAAPEGTDPSYVFLGWDKEITGICTGNAQYTAIFGAPYLPGDMNEDDQVSDADAIYLLRHTLLPNRYPLKQSGDVNSDGLTSDADAIYLLRHTMLPNRYPLFP